MEEGKVQHEPIVVAVNDFHLDIIEEMGGLLKEGQTIQYDGLFREQELKLDARLIKNSLINLLSNAIKYSEGGKIISIDTKIIDKQLIIKVIDQGIGIPEEDQQYMFTRFFRAKNAMNIKGTGLGLTIVKQYMNLMNGNIYFKSTLGKGTTFTMEIPIRNEGNTQ